MKKNILALDLILSILLFTACSKTAEENQNKFIATGIKSAKGSEIVSVCLDSGIIHSTAITCYVMGSTVFDPVTGGYGYVDCDSMFNLVNPENGTLIRSFKLPAYLSQVVLDTDDNTIIGKYAVFVGKGDLKITDTGASKNPGLTITNYVVKVKLSDGSILAHNQVDVGEGIFGCAYFYDQESKGYGLLRADKVLITVNPSTGQIIKSVNIGASLSNTVYDPDSKTLIGFTYSAETDRNSIEVYNIETGTRVSTAEIKKRDNYYGCISGFDKDSNCYFLANPDNEILFLDIATGEIKETYKLDNKLTDIKFWKR
jgi:hypothetical protein